MNWIQQHILVELTRHPERRYSELRPDGVEGNLFLYHLDGLTKDGLVEKSEKRYKLTQKGLELASTLSLETGKARQQPRVLTCVVAQNEQGEYLFSRWHRQPNVDLVSFPHGMVHAGQSLETMAALELAEKANLSAKLAYLGVVEILGESPAQNMLVHLFSAKNHQQLGEDKARPEVSEPFWSDLASLKKADFVPGFYEIAHKIDSDRPKPLGLLSIPLDTK